MGDSSNDNSQDFGNAKELSQAVIKIVSACTKAANKLPTDDDYQYYETFRGFRSVMATAQKNVLGILASMMRGNAVREHFAELDLEEQFDMIKNMNSTIFENLSTQLAESSGKKKEETELIAVTNSVMEINTSWNKMDLLNKKINTVSLLSAKNIARPQIKFKTKVDNSNSPFVPIIKEKPNSIKPLAVMLERNDDGEEFCHPYEIELDKFSPLPEQLEPCEPIPPKPLADTPLMMVETEEALASLCKVLKDVKEFAIDIEHHSYRTFQGFSCLIQISTREKDFIIDAITLRSELWVLNEVFTDPKIVKVLHGADMDVLWLQRDFGLYIVNMFDTGQAARVLSFPHLSLVYLMKHYCKINLEKRYQLADWRIRPLPAELLKYAREDTHYLLYVYDCMRNSLISKGNKNKNLLLSVYHRSKEICLKKYEKQLLTDDSYMELYKKSRKNLNAQQLYCLKELYEWRDKIARVEDESYGYVLPNHMLLQIAEVLPRDHQGILACCNPVPPLVRQQLNELHILITKASLLSPAQLQEKVEVSAALADDVTMDLNNIINCPHDIHLYEGRTEHEFHLSGSRMSIIASSATAVKIPLKEKPSVVLGRDASKKTRSSDEMAENVSSEIGESFKTMYERYMLTKKHFSIQAEEAKEKKSETNQAKESDEKSFIEVMNPALKAVFASGKKSKDRSNSSSHLANKTSSENQVDPEAGTQKMKSGAQSNMPSSTTAAIQDDSITSSKFFSKKKGSTKRPELSSPMKSASKEANPSKKFRTKHDQSSSSSHAQEEFQPFQYEQSSFTELVKSSATEKRKNTSFDPTRGRSNFRGPRGTFRNRRSQKRQKTFSTTNTDSDNFKKKWPKL